MKLGLMTKNECVNFIEFNITGDSENYNLDSTNKCNFLRA
ncbi:MAG: hypothetical protein BWX49_01628 [Bacteroidetes bacterium ADurb.Bin008]|jgi:hypothetical protein|nr:MAG: hypothetical protein BWX49_01628 [Bacteroidetes bacterium ADurb.Bin008]